MSMVKIARFLNINRSVYGVQGEDERWFSLPTERRSVRARAGGAGDRTPFTVQGFLAGGRAAARSRAPGGLAVSRAGGGF